MHELDLEDLDGVAGIDPDELDDSEAAAAALERRLVRPPAPVASRPCPANGTL